MPSPHRSPMQLLPWSNKSPDEPVCAFCTNVIPSFVVAVRLFKGKGKKMTERAFHPACFRASLKHPMNLDQRRCRRCGCTENDCTECVARTGVPCHWVEKDLCSACEEDMPEDPPEFTVI